ncbi:MAG: cytochrome C oxidase subunit IV family protein [Bacteriovoracaceae bacterium]|nr:cytochrome C oxidase subunit IV family protein [Bacteriovoracaceae bacterium]
MDNQSHSKSHKKEYFVIFGILTILTLVELWIPALKNLSSFAKASSLVFLACGKAFLVAYFFMHLKTETKNLKYIALVPLSAVLYAVALCLESIYR